MPYAAECKIINSFYDDRIKLLREIDQLRGRCHVLMTALEELMEEQNGPPLLRDAKKWHEAMDYARAAIVIARRS